MLVFGFQKQSIGKNGMIGDSVMSRGLFNMIGYWLGGGLEKYENGKTIIEFGKIH